LVSGHGDSIREWRARKIWAEEEWEEDEDFEEEEWDEEEEEWEEESGIRVWKDESDDDL
jgi:hypothetical protein